MARSHIYNYDIEFISNPHKWAINGSYGGGLNEVTWGHFWLSGSILCVALHLISKSTSKSTWTESVQLRMNIPKKSSMKTFRKLESNALRTAQFDKKCAADKRCQSSLRSSRTKHTTLETARLASPLWQDKSKPERWRQWTLKHWRPLWSRDIHPQRRFLLPYIAHRSARSSPGRLWGAWWSHIATSRCKLCARTQTLFCQTTKGSMWWLEVGSLTTVSRKQTWMGQCSRMGTNDACMVAGVTSPGKQRLLPNSTSEGQRTHKLQNSRMCP